MSNEYKSVLALAKTFDAYQSLQSDESRAVLYHLIMTLRPQRVLEIGTFRAGTARFLAQALHHAGRGLLYTIDPFGIENHVPHTINSWPAHLQHHVRFSPISSAAFFDKAMSGGLGLDLVLVDGNHELEYAAFDLACAARLMNAGGVVVMDNVDQPGPRYATQQFLAANPSWDEVKGTYPERAPETSTFADLPRFRRMHDYGLEWEAVEGLSVEPIGNSPRAEFPALELKASPVAGAHRLGVHFYDLAVDRRYRMVVWLSPSRGNQAMVDFREGRKTSSQIFCDLRINEVVHRTGSVGETRVEIGEDGWARLLIDFDCLSGEGSVYVSVLGVDKGDVLFDGSDGAALKFGGVEIQIRDLDGTYLAPLSVPEAASPNRDLRILNVEDPLGHIAPSFPDTKFFVVRAPDGLEVSHIPRSFGSVITEKSGARWLELDGFTQNAGTLHYQIFCRAFSDVVQPEELTSTGFTRLEPGRNDKIRVKLTRPLALEMTREQGYYRTEIILAFVADVPGGHLYLSRPPRTSQDS